jgi:hypothetical protein
MTRKVYKSAMGKPVDLGALLLQNENVRAVGNMSVNTRGDIVDSHNRVIENKNRQAQRHYRRQSTNVSNSSVTKGNVQAENPQPDVHELSDAFTDMPEDAFDLDLATSVPQDPEPQVRGGLAVAIARSREVKQQLEKTRKQLQQEQGLKKI